MWISTVEILCAYFYIPELDSVYRLIYSHSSVYKKISINFFLVCMIRNEMDTKIRFILIYFALKKMRFHSSIWNKMSLSVCSKMFLWELRFLFPSNSPEKCKHIRWCQRNAVAVVNVTTFKLHISEAHEHFFQRNTEKELLRNEHWTILFLLYLSW